jgi:hypothetical protein
MKKHIVQKCTHSKKEGSGFLRTHLLAEGRVIENRYGDNSRLLRFEDGIAAVGADGRIALFNSWIMNDLIEMELVGRDSLGYYYRRM